MGGGVSTDQSQNGGRNRSRMSMRAKQRAAQRHRTGGRSSGDAAGGSSSSQADISRQGTQSESSSNQQIVPYQPDSPSRRWQSAWAEGDDNLQLFSTRRPRDFGAGLSSGLKNAAKGVGLGAAALIAAPVYGASQEGVGGFFKGLGAGVVMAVALPVAGVGLGIAQLARGTFNTPEAVRESHAGRKWDKKKREWKDNWYSLDTEQEEVHNLNFVFEEQKKELAAGAAERGRSAQPRHQGPIVETEYYDTLGVPTTATQAEIRKAYYQLARDCHPDKNPGDPTAHQKFQALGEAYQVLGDDKRRSDYDTRGKAAAEDMPIIDSSLFFTMLFGSEAFEPLIGKLKMAMFVEIFENTDTPGAITEKIMEFEQRKREVELAVKLRDRLQDFVEGDEKKKSQWRESMVQKAQELCTYSFGDAMVEAIGWIYENYSCQFLGKLDTFLGLGGRYAKLQAKNREMGNLCRIAGSAVKASIAATKLAKAEEKKEKAAKDREAKKLKETKKEQLQKEKEKEGGQKETKKEKEKESGRQAPSKKDEGAKTERQDTAKSMGEQFFAKSPSKAAEASPEGAGEAEAEEGERPSADEQQAHMEGAKQLQETMPLILETMLNVCLMDIEATIRQAAKKMLKDLATPIETRRQRAEALLELGKIFQAEAQKYKDEHKDMPVDLIRRMEEAFIRVAQEADREAQHKAGHDKDDQDKDSPAAAAATTTTEL